jgi:hypothetical protein
MKLSAILATLWLAIKIGLLQYGYPEDRYGVILNLVFIILIVFVGVRNTEGTKEVVPMIKSAMRPAAVYVILVSIFVFAYYSFVDPGYLPSVFDRTIQDVEQAIADEGGFEEFRKGLTGSNASTKEEYVAEFKNNAGGMISLFSPYGRASIALMLLTFFALFYTLFMVGVFKLAMRLIPR